jgi:glycosyltransferase involved in cell wall biosynthesis
VASEGVPEEVVADSYNGLRVPFADPQALAEAVARILESPELRARLSKDAVEHARSFSRERIRENLEEVLRSVGPGQVPAEMVTA